jgi:HlyD family secretion protein
MGIHVKFTRGRVVGGVVTLAFVGMGAFALRPKPMVVDTATVRHQLLESTIDADGHARVRNRYAVVAPVAGRLLRSGLVEGAAVRVGDVIARISPLPLDPAAAAQARARLDAARALAVLAAGQQRVTAASLAQRRRELSRAQRLAEVGGVAPRIVEECQLALADAKEAASGASQRVRAADAETRQAEAALAGDPGVIGEAVLVRAPAEGRVLRLADRSERIVAPGTPILEIGDPRAIEVVINVLSSDASAIASGNPVRLTGWVTTGLSTEGAAIAGRVREIEPAAFSKLSALGVEERRVNVIVEVTDALDRIADGYRVDAQVVVWSQQHVLSVPTSALVRASADASQGWIAYVIRDGRIERRQLRLGRTGNGAAAVISGLDAGDEVVVFPSDRVQLGMRATRRPAGVHDP